MGYLHLKSIKLESISEQQAYALNPGGGISIRPPSRNLPLRATGRLVFLGLSRPGRLSIPGIVSGGLQSEATFNEARGESIGYNPKLASGGKYEPQSARKLGQIRGWRLF